MDEIFKSVINEFELPLNNPVLVFLLILLIILFSPVLLRKINIPGIIGLIISGVIVGPFGLKIIENNSAIELFSTIGLLYIMFLAGLDFDMNNIKANRNRSLLFGFLTFFIPLTIGFPVCFYLLGYDFNASFLTASMFSTHTLIAYPIVSKFGISKNQTVAITVGGTILTDTVVLIILAIVLGNNQGSLDIGFWIKLVLSLGVFSAIMFVAIPKIAGWFFRKLESEKHTHYIFVLAVVFFAAFLAEMAGIEPIIGAFIAGLALNRLIPNSSALMNRIEFIGNSLFIPFFLISVGMIVNLGVITRGPMAIIIAVTLSTVALTSKWLAAFFTQVILKFNANQRQLIFGLSSSHAAATLAIILVGFKAGILDENILNGTIILILITCLVASFVTEKAARKIVLSTDSVVITASKYMVQRNEHILLPIANYSNFDKLFEFSLLVKNRNAINPVSILSVIPNDKDAEINIIESRKKLEEYVKQASIADINVKIVTIIDHNITGGIIRTARELLIDIIIIGWPQPSGLLDKLVGEKVDRLVSYSNKTIFICSIIKPFIFFKRIVILSPPLAERERGFEVWLYKLSAISQELKIPVVFYGNTDTYETVKGLFKKNNIAIQISSINIENWVNIDELPAKLKKTDLLLFVTARKGNISYNSTFDFLPSKLDKLFDDYSKILIYPHQSEQHYKIEGYEVVTSSTVNTGIKKLKNLRWNLNWFGKRPG